MEDQTPAPHAAGQHPPVRDPEHILTFKARIPDHVVFREFALETVVLNLDTGQYHSLNATGGRMLETLREKGSVAEAARALGEEFPKAGNTIARDLCVFCLALSKRGLVELIES